MLRRYILLIVIFINFLSPDINAQPNNHSQLLENITHLHEINDSASVSDVEATMLPITDDTNNQMMQIDPKPVKKKPYAILEKPSDIDKHRHLAKQFDTHSIAFDFNLDDLEDIHENIKKGDLTSEEEELLRDDDEHFKYENVDFTDLGFSTLPPNDDSSILENLSTASNGIDSKTTTGLGSPNIFRVTKNKSKTKGRELLKKEVLQKNFGNHFNSVNQFFIEHGNHTADTENINENLFQIMVNLFDHFYWQPSEIKMKVSPVCGVELIAYLSALNNNYEWAQKAYDSSGRYRGQIMFGNNLWVGERHFCIEVNRVAGERKHFDFGFYAANILIKADLPTKMTRIIQLGECLPKSCTIKDVQTILELDPHSKMLSSLNSTHQNAEIKVVNMRRVPGSYDIWNDMKFKIFIGFIVTIMFLIVYATWFESKLHSDESESELNETERKESNNTKTTNNNANNLNDKAFELYQMNSTDNNNVDVEAAVAAATNFSKIKTNEQHDTKDDEKLGKYHSDQRTLGLHEKTLLCFAFPSNAAAIFSLQRNKDDNISCVHGIRVLSLLWTVMVHTYLQIFTISENRFRRNIAERSFVYQMIGNATFSVDSFFFLSGLLVVLIFLKHSKTKDMDFIEYTKRGILKSGFLFIYRYLRLTPVYLFVIIFNELSLMYVFNGTVFTPTVAHESCTNYWWRNILYINNFYPLKELCMIWSWYLANDMQFYIMAIILLVISTRYLKFSVVTMLVFLVTSWGTSGILSIHHDYIHKVSDPFESFDFLYDKPWQRVGTYIVGMMTGYAVHRIKTPPKIPKGLNYTLWTFSVGLLFSLIFGVWNGKLSLLATAFYVSIGHTAWGVGLAWITLSCCWGYSPFLNKILSYQGFLPLSRLTYCSYLVHPVLMLIISFLMEGPVHLQHLFIFSIFLGNAVLSFMVAFLISVAFEAPVIRLLKIYLKK